MRTLILFILLLAGKAAAATQEMPAEVVDEVNPRSPSTRLTIEFKPWRCTECVKEGILPPETLQEPITMMRMPVEKLAEICELRRDWLAIETPHFKIFSNLRRDKIKTEDSTFLAADIYRLAEILPKINPTSPVQVLTAHQRAHLYQIRVERIYAHLAALTKNDRPLLGMKAKYELYLFDNYNEHHIFCDRFTGRANDKAGIQHHIREEPNFMMFTQAESQVQGGDIAFANNIIHNVAHNLIDGWGNYYRETWAFLEAGVAHYYERRETPRYNTFCWSEGRPPTELQKPNWESSILSFVRRGKDTPLSEWCEKVQPGELTGVEHGLAWSMIKWLIETDPIRFTKLVELQQDYEHKPTAAQAIEQAFGVTPTVLHQRWREYVLEEYPKLR